MHSLSMASTSYFYCSDWSITKLPSLFGFESAAYGVLALDRARDAGTRSGLCRVDDRDSDPLGQNEASMISVVYLQMECRRLRTVPQAITAGIVLDPIHSAT
jgi:hypothetical protein